jgi:putative hydrolase of the HAD superfamily
MNVSMRKKPDDYRALVLDMDGTLYRQLPVRLCMALSLLVYYCVHPGKVKELLALKEFRKLRERGSFTESEDFEEQQYRYISERSGLDTGAVKRLVSYWMLERPLKYIRRFRNRKLLSRVEALRKKGALVIVYSDYPVTDKLKAVGLRADHAFCAQDDIIRCLKPCGKGLANIIKLIGVPAEEMLFIGDRYEKDGLCAASVGMDAWII